MLESHIYQSADGFCTMSGVEYSLPGVAGNAVLTVKGAIPAEVIEQLHLLCVDAMPVIGHSGRTLGGTNPHIKMTTDLNLIDTDEVWRGEWSREELLKIGYDLRELDMSVCRGLTEALGVYRAMNRFLDNVALEDTGYQMQKYEKGVGHYITHCDSTPADGTNRALGCVIYLNTVEDGGQTHFEAQDLYVTPEAGKILLFPAYWTHPHEAMIPVSDDKYIISTFICGKPGEEYHDDHH